MPSRDQATPGTDTESPVEARYRPACIECVMTWLLRGDGAICLACDAPVYLRKKEGK